MNARSTYWRAKPWPEWVSLCRTWVPTTLRCWGIELTDDLRTALELVISELVTNTVRHGGPLQEYVTVRLLAVDDLVLLEVIDTSQIHHLPELIEADDENEGGRGLALVDAPSRDWGYYPTADGKSVWALLGLPPEGACPPAAVDQPKRSVVDPYEHARPSPLVLDAISA